MNSNYGKSMNAFDFDLGFNSSASRSLNDQKNKTTSSSSSSSYTYSTMQSKPNSNKSTWIHQPLSGHNSMVGDIFGKSWTSSTTTNVASSVGIANKNPHLFGDLVSSALGGGKSNSDFPLKNANKGTFLMGSMADNLPKSTQSVKTGGNSGYNANSNVNLSGGNSKSPNLGGPSLKNMTASGVAGGMGVKKDPFGSLVDFASKPGANMKSRSNQIDKNSSGDDTFGDFQNAAKSAAPGVQSDPFATSNSFASNSGSTNSQSQPPVTTHSPGVDDFDSLFASTAASSVDLGGSEKQQPTGGDDWGFESEFVGANDSSGTTELDGLPPPPAGVNASAAKSKGMDNHKQGQYADAIKWLSWAVILLERAGDEAGVMEVLSSRASCYKEVGEYKKAVADCSKVLDHDGANVSVLVQRALLYESMEKYRLGAEDLRTVMKIDPGNRVARSTIHRLTKMAD